MAGSYRIYRDLGLVVVRYSGFVTLAESFELVGRYLRDPQRRAGQKQLVDLSAVTEFERDFPRTLALQAQKSQMFAEGPASLVVYYAPTPVAQTMARLIIRSWERLGAMVPLMQETEAGALNLLGLRERRLSEVVTRPADP